MAINLDTLRVVHELDRRLPVTLFHEFQSGVLATYSNIERLLKLKKIRLTSDGDFILGDKYYLCTRKNENAAAMITQHYKVVATELFPNLKKNKKEEVVYSLDEVFNRKNYKNAKKYHKAVTRGFNVASRENLIVREIRENDYDKVVHLNDKWVRWKIYERNVFRSTFSTAKYRNCVRYALDNGRDYLTIGVFGKEGQLYGFRCIYIRDDRAFGLAFINDPYAPITNFPQVSEILTLDYLRQKVPSVKIFNSGLSNIAGSAHGSLGGFKKHLPHKVITYYEYPKSDKK